MRELPGVRELLDRLAGRSPGRRPTGCWASAWRRSVWRAAVEEVGRALRLDRAEEALRQAAAAGDLDAADRALADLPAEQAREVTAAAFGGLTAPQAVLPPSMTSVWPLTYEAAVGEQVDHRPGHLVGLGGPGDGGVGEEPLADGLVLEEGGGEAGLDQAGGHRVDPDAERTPVPPPGCGSGRSPPPCSCRRGP